MNPHELFSRLLAAMVEADLEAVAELIHPDFIGDFPQSGERAHGVEGFQAQLESYPGGTPEVASGEDALRIVGGDERWMITPSYAVIPMALPDVYTALSRARYPDGSMWWVVSLITLRDEKVFRTETYFAPEFDPPEWRKGMVEIVPRATELPRD